jgi:hypothetical protein
MKLFELCIPANEIQEVLKMCFDRAKSALDDISCINIFPTLSKIQFNTKFDCFSEVRLTRKLLRFELAVMEFCFFNCGVFVASLQAEACVLVLFCKPHTHLPKLAAFVNNSVIEDGKCVCCELCLFESQFRLRDL